MHYVQTLVFLFYFFLENNVHVRCPLCIIFKCLFSYKHLHMHFTSFQYFLKKMYCEHCVVSSLCSSNVSPDSGSFSSDYYSGANIQDVNIH